MMFGLRSIGKTILPVGAVALMALALSGAANAQENKTVTLKSVGGELKLIGELDEFTDGTYFITVKGMGNIEINANDVTCEGAACPVIKQYEPYFGIYGSRTVGTNLIPNLMRGYAKHVGATYEIAATDKAAERKIRLTNPDGTLRLEVDLQSRGSGTAFPALADGSAMIGVADRRMKDSDLAKLQAAGIGELRDTDNEIVIGVDGIVVILNPDGSVASLVEIRGRRNLRVHRSHPTGGWNRQGDHAMTKNTATSTSALLANEAGYDPIEDRLRQNIRATIEAVFEEELEQFLGRCRYGRSGGAKAGYRHGHRERQLVGTFGTETVRVPRARITGEAGKAREWRSKALPRYQRLTKKAEALIAAVYLSGTNTRRVKRALFGLFQGAVSKDVVSRAWRKVKVDWQAWCARSLADEDIVRLILDGTVIKTRIDRKATNISVLAAIGVRRDGQKVLLSLMNMGGESTSAWRQFINDLDARGLKRPEFVIVDGAPGLEVALIALWGEDLPIQRCTVHKHRNLLAKAPKRMHDELTEDYRDMIYAKTPEEIATRRKAFLRKWRLKCKAVADSLEEAGDKLFTFTRLPQGQWKSARTTNAIERLNEEFRRRIKTQTVLPCAETVPMLLWALMASGQIVMRKVDGWETLAQPVADATLDQAA